MVVVRASKVLPEVQLTDGMKQIAEYAQGLAKRLIYSDIRVEFAHDADTDFEAAYRRGRLVFNVARLGEKWFDRGAVESVDDLLLHEFGHHYSMDHRSCDFQNAITMLGARLRQVAIKEPDFFNRYTRIDATLYRKA